MEMLSIVQTLLVILSGIVIKCSSSYVCNRSLTCDGNTETTSQYYYYNNKSCQLVPSNCHFINTSSYLFQNISYCIAKCGNVTGGNSNHGDGLNLFVLIPSCAGGALFILVVVIVTIVIIRRRSRYKAKRYYEQVLAMINDDANDYDYDDDDDDIINDDVIK